MDVRREVRLAEERIRPHIRETPLEHSARFSRRTGCEVFFKLENLQHTGSFKARGAMNRLLALTPDERERGIVTASSGNHGAAVAYGLSRLGLKGTIFVPENVSPTKSEAIQAFGADLRRFGNDSGLTELHAREQAERSGRVYVSPYNDPVVIGGQGTVGLELERQIDAFDALFASVGGGGLISGTAGWLKGAGRAVHVVGGSPENSAVMAASVKSGRILQMESKPTLSDGTAGAVEPGAITLPLCCDLVDEFALVSEEEIRDALRLFMETHHMMIEGAAGVAIASFLRQADRWRGRRVVIVLCGANISLETLRSVL